MDGGVWPRAVALLAVEVLDEGGEGVEVAAGGVPANEYLTWVCAQVEGEHLFLVLHVDLDLLGGLGVGDGVAVADLDFGAIFAARAEEGANDAFLVGGATEGVIEYREDGLVTLCQHSGIKCRQSVRALEAVWRRSAGQSTVGRRRELGRGDAPDGGRSRAQT